MAALEGAPPNPYVGPKPFEKQKLFGRDREISELRYLLTSERIVLLYAPSGAGKSSLVQAGLIPTLKDRFDVWGPTRVNQQPSIPVSNRYIWSAIAGLERTDTVDPKLTLQDYVKKRRGTAKPLLIIDQFEEILRVDPVDLAGKRAFFADLGELLRDPGIWALLVLREDYLAPLDPYARLLPTYLQNRYRIDRLTCPMAAQSIGRPTEDSPRKYKPGVVDKLVENLAKVKVQQADGSILEEQGNYVEPLQLQVVCFDLWERIEPPARLEIDFTDLGDIDGALQSYYDKAVRTIAGSDPVTERAIREWFQDKLITSDGLRNQVRQEGTQTGGLDEKLVSKLVDTYLVRSEPRGGTTWYELAHDRLVAPLRACNSVWFELNSSKLQKRAALWGAQNRPDSLLFGETDLREAQDWATANEAILKPVDRDLLAASEKKQQLQADQLHQYLKEKQQARSLRLALQCTGLFAILSVAALGYSGYQWYRNRDLKIKAIAATTQAEDNLKRATDAEDALKAFGDKCVAEGVSVAGTLAPPIVQYSAGPSSQWTVYFHLRKGSAAQETLAESMKKTLESSGKCKVAPFEYLSIGTKRRELRYFQPSQSAAAEEIAAMLPAEPKITVQYFDRYEKKNPASVPSHFELWFEPDRTQLQTLVGRIVSDDETDRKSALQELVTEDDKSTAAIQEVLALLNRQGKKGLTVEAAINCFYFLMKSDASAWTPAQVKMARAAVGEARTRFPKAQQLGEELSAVEKLLASR